MLRYDNKDLGLRGTLTGNWLYWNAGPYTYYDSSGNPSQRIYPVSDQGMSWNLHLSWKTRPREELSPEVFCSVRNIFNGSQTDMRIMYPSEPRWFEGGVRLRF
jgi:vitamin B12 transporter